MTQVSLTITNFGDGALGPLLDTARAADAGGLDTLWVPDHLMQVDPNADPGGAMFEAYTLLGHLAAHTTQIRLGTMVTAATYRPPALTVKAVITLDVLSGGRAWIGVGSGYQEDEAAAMDLPLPPQRERFEMLEDLVRLAHHMWAGETGPFDGIHVHAANPLSRPAPATNPRPPILIGGMGERRTLRLVAEYGDACNLFDIPDGGATVKHKLAVLDRHLEDVGRPREAVERTISTRLEPGESAEQFTERCRSLAALGVDHVVCLHPMPWTTQAVETLAEARAALAA